MTLSNTDIGMATGLATLIIGPHLWMEEVVFIPRSSRFIQSREGYLLLPRTFSKYLETLSSGALWVEGKVGPWLRQTFPRSNFDLLLTIAKTKPSSESFPREGTHIPRPLWPLPDSLSPTLLLKYARKPKRLTSVSYMEWAGE